ncbi:MAG: hypothetical protein WC346_13100 [Methanogenium sp.]|jgi:hypothetical protein
MAIPIDVWIVFIALAAVCTGYSWLGRDAQNYTDAICGVIAMLLWFVSGIACLIGIQTDFTTFTAGYLFWIFIAIGAIEGIITIVKILDIVTSRKNQRFVKFEDLRL